VRISNPLSYLPTPTPESKRGALIWVISIVILNALGFVWTVYRNYKEGKKPKWHLIWYVVFFTLVMLFFESATDYPQIPAQIVAVLGLHLAQLLAVVLVAVLGFAASEFKLRSKLYYGTLEVFFGMVSSIAVVTRVHFTPVPVSQMTLPQITALVGSIYVVARGVTNIREAKNTPPA
jgi:CDP-diglyceride synthetase